MCIKSIINQVFKLTRLILPINIFNNRKYFKFALGEFLCEALVQMIFVHLTRIALTSPISKTVGPRLKMRALRTKEMPLVPRSIALDKAPVWRLRWKPRSRLCRWRKTFLAIRRIELWATLPNTVFLSSLKRAAQARDTPSGRVKKQTV